MEWEEERIVARLEAIVAFLRRHERLWRAHVVDFFRERLWEILDEEWIGALKDASMEDLLLLPSHISKDCWPETLKIFLKDASSLSLPRSLDSSKFPLDGGASLPTVITQGMNAKKLHEIERLSSLIVNVSRAVNATEIVDVGAGQGYLAQVLAFHHNLPVTAVDCSAHNSGVTNKRAERIKKYYDSRSGRATSSGPKTRTCHIGSDVENMSLDSFLTLDNSFDRITNPIDIKRSIVLAGLHACGDLSANMLKTFVHHQDVTAVVSVGCCYNLLTEIDDRDRDCGFPMSKQLKQMNFRLGGAGRDLGCQSADRWKDIGLGMAAANFEIHAFRAAFQIVLHRFYPEVAAASPSVGRLGKSKRRKQTRRAETRTPESKDGDEIFEAFQQYSAAALNRLGLDVVSGDSLLEVWKQVEPFRALIGPFWSLRSAVAPVLESMLLLDRLLYLKEEEKERAMPFDTLMILPVFNASVSPRNMAIVVSKSI